MGMWVTFSNYPEWPGIFIRERILPTFGECIRDRGFLLPLVAAACMVVALSWMPALSHAGPPKRKISHLGAMELQAKDSEDGLSRYGQAAFTAGEFFSPEPGQYRDGILPHEISTHYIHFSFATPSRASPFVNSFAI